MKRDSLEKKISTMCILHPIFGGLFFFLTAASLLWRRRGIVRKLAELNRRTRANYSIWVAATRAWWCSA